MAVEIEKQNKTKQNKQNKKQKNLNGHPDYIGNYYS